MPLLLWILFGYIALMSVAAFALYGVDKARSKRRAWRIRERTLLLFAFLGGAPGAFLGMLAFRHKTQHLKFTLLVPIALVLWIAITVFAVVRLTV